MCPGTRGWGTQNGVECPTTRGRGTQTEEAVRVGRPASPTATGAAAGDELDHAAVGEDVEQLDHRVLVDAEFLGQRRLRRPGEPQRVRVGARVVGEDPRKLVQLRLLAVVGDELVPVLAPEAGRPISPG